MMHALVYPKDGPPYCATCANSPLFARPVRCPDESALRELGEKWRTVRASVEQEKRATLEKR